MKVIKEQKYLKTPGLILLITLLSMVAPVANDMYLPAMPIMTEEFHVDAAALNNTILIFTVMMAIGILLFGPISDKYGRKKILILSVLMYCIGSLGCMASYDISLLMVSRSVQALGAGGMNAVSIAIVKDSFEGKSRGSILAIVQSLFFIAPVVAPIVGAWVLLIAGWQAVFIVIFIIGLIILLLSVFYQESIPDSEKCKGSVAQAYKQIFSVGKNVNFTPFLIMCAIYAAPFMAYLGMSSFIYQGQFSLNPQENSFFFAVNSVLTIMGPLLCIVLNGRIKKTLITTLYMVLGLLSAIAVFVFGQISPLIFLICFAPFCITSAFARPLITDILLDQHDGDTGSASALINFTLTTIAAIAMYIGALPWGDYVFSLGITMISFILVSLVMWFIILKSKKINMRNMD